MGNLRQSMTTEEWEEMGKRLSSMGGDVTDYGGATPLNHEINNVNHPAHYGGEDNPYEVIKIINAQGWGWSFCLGNALKYIMRAGKKTPDATEDLQKAIWYIQHALKQIQTDEQKKNNTLG
jgi:hypothetical protein